MRYIVRFRPEAALEVESTLRRMGIRIVSRVFDYLVIEAPSEAVEAIKEIPGVVSVSAEKTYKIAVMPVEQKLSQFLRMISNPLTAPFAFAWALSVKDKERWALGESRKVVEADIAESEGITGKGVKVAVLDTGWDRFAVQKVNIDYTSSTVEGQPEVLDENGHGMWCISCIGGQELNTPWGVIKGVAPDATIAAIKCLGYGIGSGSNSAVLRAMAEAVAWGADVVSMSLGGDIEPNETHDIENCPLCRIVESLSDNTIFSIAAGNSGVGYASCLPKDTNVFTVDGPRKISELKVGDYVYSFVDGRIEPKKVTNVVNMGLRETWIIRTEHFTLRATPDHPLLALKGGKLLWAPLEQLNVDNYLVAPYGFYQGNGEPALPPIELSKYIAHNRVKKVEIKDKLAFMRVLGYLLGDGYVELVPGSKKVILTAMKEHMVNMYRALIKRAFGIEAPWEGKRRFVINSSILAEALAKLGFAKKSRERIVPSWIFALKREYVYEFIRGFLDAEGYFHHKYEIGLELSSSDLAKGIKYLLQYVGIHTSNIYERKTRPRCFPSGRFHPGGQKTYTIGIYDLPRTLVDLGYVESAVPAIPTFDYSAMEFEKILSIERYGVEEVYDITVEGSHNFIAEGLVVHNCPGLAPSAITVAAVDSQGKIADFVSRKHKQYIQLEKPIVSAPGVNTLAASCGLIDVMEWMDGPKLAAISGTSMATPHVSGVIALWIEYARKRGIKLTSRDIHECIRQGRSWDPDYGYGIIKYSWIKDYLKR